MAEYIEREALQNALQRKQAGPANKRYTEGWNDCIMRVKSMVHSAKAADVAPVVHGEWIEKTDSIMETYYVCSACDEAFYLIDGTPTENIYNFCPSCGAKMDGERKGDDD